MSETKADASVDPARTLREAKLDEPRTKPTLRQIGRALASSAFRKAEGHQQEVQERKLEALCAVD